MENIFKGLGVALVTPFNADGTIDYESLASLIDCQLADGVDFFCVLGSTAETPCLSLDEKLQIKKFVVERVGGRIPILLGMGGNCTASVLKEMSEFDFSGIDGILSVCPYYNKPAQEGIYRHFEAIAKSSTLPIVLYNVPGRTGVNMQVETTLKLACDFENIVAIKEASGDLEQIYAIIADRPAGFDVLSGDDSLAYDLISQGAVGVISVIGNAYPKMFGDLIHNTIAHHRKEALILNSRFSILYRELFVDGNPAGIKSLLSIMGKCRNVLRLPLVPASRQTFIKLSSEYDKLKG